MTGLEFIGYCALGVLARAGCKRLYARADSQDFVADQFYRINNAARPKGFPNLPAPVTPEWWTLPTLSTFLVVVFIKAFDSDGMDLSSLIDATAFYGFPPLVGSLLATYELRNSFRERWRMRRADPEDRITHEFGRVEH